MARVAKRRPARRATSPEGTPRKRTVRIVEDGDDSDGERLGFRSPSKKSRLDDIYDVPLDDDEKAAAAAASTPKRKAGRPKRSAVETDDGQPERDETKATPTRQRHRRSTATATPVKAIVDTPMRRKMADRSARRKSNRALIDRVVRGGDEDEDEEALEAAIFGEEEEEEEEEEVEEEVEEEEEEGRKEEKENREEDVDMDSVASPSKRKEAPAVELSPTKRGPGRPRKNPAMTVAEQRRLQSRQRREGRGQDQEKGRSQEKGPEKGPGRGRGRRAASPPRDLPAHEDYFFQHRPGAATSKTSDNTLASLRLLTHDEYFRLRGATAATTTTQKHEAATERLEQLHGQSFGQWAFELSEGFSVCLYGYGSKRRVLRAFAKALYAGIDDHAMHKIVMVDGRVGGNAVLRTLQTTVAAAISTDGSDDSLPPGNAAERVLASLLHASPVTVTVVLDGIDAPALRRPTTQAVLARLAAHPRVQLLCAADTPGCVLLWDGATRAALQLVFHDATTFRGLDGTDTNGNVVDDVHALLGRKVRRVGGKDGAAFVLRSLPENARTLFRLLVGEVLASSEGGRTRDNDEGNDDDEDDDQEDHNDEYESVGLEYRMLYNKAVEEFICSSEMAFRTLLKEFHDHQMVTSRKDAFGTELLSLPFRRDELEALLEELA